MAGPDAGFTEGEPWIRLHEDHERVNVETQRANPESVWHYYRRLIELRGAHDVLVYGEYENHTPDDEQVWAYTRTVAADREADADAGDDDGGIGDDSLERAFVALNWSGEETVVQPPTSVENAPASLALSNYPEPESVASVEPYRARPWEARVYLLE